jgi:hypothetical protein
MPEALFPERGDPLTKATLRRNLGGKSPLYEFLEYYATRDIQLEKHEFTGQGGFVNGEYWVLENSSGTGAANFALTTASGGYVQGDTGTSDNGSISLSGPVIYSGDENCGMECRVQVDAITDENFEIGFIDAIPGSNASGVSDIDTPAATFSDGALVQLDTDQTLTTMAFITDGSTASQDVAATTLAAPASTNLVADTWKTFRVQLFGNYAYLWVDGILAAAHDAAATQAAGALEGGVLLAPWFFWRTRSTTAKFPKIQYVTVWQDRVA